ncbi:MAG TPA: PaaI family thioesterase [Candidatus Lokiarchaeia archaeon]|nr:PaaI family thioesterase [Candidatus Lokiarchaeia archaeon]
MSDESEKIAARSERMLALFNSIIGQPIQDFPVPPFSKWLNGRVLSAQRGAVEMEFDVRPEMANPTGLLHGGMQCAAMDDVIGITCATLGYEGFLISIDFHVDYLGKVKVGETVRVSAAIQREGRNIVNAHADIFDKDGQLIATANSNLIKTSHKLDLEKFRE